MQCSLTTLRMEIVEYNRVSYEHLLRLLVDSLNESNEKGREFDYTGTTHCYL